MREGRIYRRREIRGISEKNKKKNEIVCFVFFPSSDVLRGVRAGPPVGTGYPQTHVRTYPTIRQHVAPAADEGDASQIEMRGKLLSYHRLYYVI